MGYGAKGEIAQSLSINSLAKIFFPVDTAIIPQWILFSPMDTSIIPQWNFPHFISEFCLSPIFNPKGSEFTQVLQRVLKKEENVVKKK